MKGRIKAASTRHKPRSVDGEGKNIFMALWRQQQQSGSLLLHFGASSSFAVPLLEWGEVVAYSNASNIAFKQCAHSLATTHSFMVHPLVLWTSLRIGRCVASGDSRDSWRFSWRQTGTDLPQLFSRHACHLETFLEPSSTADRLSSLK